MLNDRYDNPLTTQSSAARDAYISGTDAILSANAGAEDFLLQAISADEGFALAHAALARSYQISARGADAAKAIARARELTEGLSAREKGHVAMMGHLIDGDGPSAYAAARQHLCEFPRDAVIAQPLTGVFGLIGFSGIAGREAEQLDFLARLAQYYGDDWWFSSQYAFAQVEAGQLDRAFKTIEISLKGNPRSAHGAHIRAHIHYERGETETGFRYLKEWRTDYDKGGALHCHISWHVALWTLECGDAPGAWRLIDDAVRPGAAWGPPLNVLTDTVSFMHRAALLGETVQPERWAEIAEFAQRIFPNPGLAFADLHAALAHAMTGDANALQKIIANPTGPAGEVVTHAAQAFGAFARQEWAQSIGFLTPIMAEHERFGGSRAQRDLIEFTMVAALLKADRGDDARLMLKTRRPNKAAANPVAGL
jgi:hypothetical protein